MIINADVIVDLQAGDTGKGKVAYSLAQTKAHNLVMRYNGGPNAGHTVYHEGNKIVTHQVPVGVFHNIPSLIGRGCVVDLGELVKEIEMLQSYGINVSPNTLYIDANCHLIMKSHVDEDNASNIIGTTGKGIGPAYRDKYARKGVRLGSLRPSDFDYSKEFSEIYFRKIFEYFSMVDTHKLLYDNSHINSTKYKILCEGAQGFQIDIDWGEYPYVTSSHCTVGSVCLNGIAPTYIRHVYGIMKVYETYSGYKTTFVNDDSPELDAIQQVGNEFGATTGRKRQVRWLDIDSMKKAAQINGVNHIVINKIDILDKLNVYKLVKNGQIYTLPRSYFITMIEDSLAEIVPKSNIIWSCSETIL